MTCALCVGAGSDGHGVACVRCKGSGSEPDFNPGVPACERTQTR